MLHVTGLLNSILREKYLSILDPFILDKGVNEFYKVLLQFTTAVTVICFSEK